MGGRKDGKGQKSHSLDGQKLKKIELAGRIRRVFFVCGVEAGGSPRKKMLHPRLKSSSKKGN